MTANQTMPADDAPTPTDAMQRAFARLVTSPQARARFAVDPHAEAPALAALPARHVDFYARGVLAKRFAEVRRLLPHVARATGLAERFRAHAATFAPGGDRRHRIDAIAFARTLEAAKGRLARAARVDRLALEARSGGRFVAVAFACGRVHVWLRIAPAGTLWTGTVTLPSGRETPRGR